MLPGRVEACQPEVELGCQAGWRLVDQRLNCVARKGGGLSTRGGTVLPGRVEVCRSEVEPCGQAGGSIVKQRVIFVATKVEDLRPQV